MKTIYATALLGAALVLGACERTPTQLADAPPAAAPNRGPAAEAAKEKTRADADANRQIAEIRQATARYHNIVVAIADGYVPISPCVEAPGVGGMGIHYANPALMQDAGMTPTQPEMLLYLPGTDGSMRLVAVEYAIVQQAWHAAGHQDAPSFLGHGFDVLPGNDAAGRPTLYTLHAWVWQPNPSGMFAPFNPRISCPPGGDMGGHATHAAR
jgi:hypothetical protein